MSALVYLIPVALGLGLASLAGFLWSLASGQYEDLEGAGARILIEDIDGAQIEDRETGDA